MAKKPEGATVGSMGRAYASCKPTDHQDRTCAGTYSEQCSGEGPGGAGENSGVEGMRYGLVRIHKPGHVE
jgi:hypothetical protein